MSELVTGIVIGLISVVASVLLSGAFTIVHSKSISKRSDIKRRLSEIESKAESFRIAGGQYWRIDLDQLSANDLEREIKRLRKSIGLNITAFQENGCKISRQCDVKWAAFIREVSGTNFNRNTYFEKNPHSADPPRINQINSICEDFISKLRKSLDII